MADAYGAWAKGKSKGKAADQSLRSVNAYAANELYYNGLEMTTTMELASASTTSPSKNGRHDRLWSHGICCS